MVCVFLLFVACVCLVSVVPGVFVSINSFELHTYICTHHVHTHTHIHVCFSACLCTHAHTYTQTHVVSLYVYDVSLGA